MKRRSGQLDFSKLGPLKSSGTVGFSTFRDRDSQPASRRMKTRKSNGILGNSAMDADSDEDDDDDDRADALLAKMEDVDSKDDKSKSGLDDAKFTGELADGVNRIRPANPRRPGGGGITTPPEPSTTTTGGPAGSGLAPLGGAAGIFGKALAEDSDVVGSPMKKARPSLGAEIYPQRRAPRPRWGRFRREGYLV
ncbi:Nuclear transport factor 2 [Collariella sp. IMI 366227]|nr:Nuclear transport factor 2 [Collariella sp. IMI 366227]